MGVNQQHPFHRCTDWCRMLVHKGMQTALARGPLATYRAILHPLCVQQRQGVCSQLEAKAPGAPGEVPPLVQALNAEVAGLAAEYLALMEALKIRDGVAKVLQVSSAGNKFLQVRPTPHTLPPPLIGFIFLLECVQVP